MPQPRHPAQQIAGKRDDRPRRCNRHNDHYEKRFGVVAPVDVLVGRSPALEESEHQQQRQHPNPKDYLDLPKEVKKRRPQIDRWLTVHVVPLRLLAQPIVVYLFILFRQLHEPPCCKSVHDRSEEEHKRDEIQRLRRDPQLEDFDQPEIF